MKRFNKVMGIVLALILSIGITACQSKTDEASGAGGSGGGAAPSADGAAPAADSGKEGDLDYSFGLDKTFHSDKPVTYSMLFNDMPWYPYKKDWRLWSAIAEKTNVSFDVTVVPTADYEQKKSLLVNSGDAPFIIPKTYDESAYVAGGQIVPISDWVKYMPNYTQQVKEWHMEEDLKQQLQANGKYYKLPGMWQSAGGGYSYAIRKDVFEKAGVDLSNADNWTYEDFYDAMKKVKDFTGKKNIMSLLYNGKSTLNIAAVVYGVTGGWGLGNGMNFDWDKQQFYFADATNDFKTYVAYLHKWVADGILDPESFTQTDDQAKAKFTKGDSYVINTNYQTLADLMTKMEDKNAELYMIVQPGGPKGMLQIETSRLENGIMISQNALDKLGKDGFIKMLRFIDWLWYSPEGHTLALWGVEGETYTKDADGNIKLNPDITYNGINPTASKKLNADFGFGGGVFAYGGSDEIKMSKMTEGEKDYTNRILTMRQPRKLNPPIMASPDESEQLNLISKPLMDYVNTMTLKFITGQADIAKEWDTYVATCKANGSDRYTQMANDIFAKTKSTLGY